jgi:polysaccharide pyruvyl transferase WcaK-like protein
MAPPRIGLFGTFDLENLGDTLFPRVIRAEIGRRLPNADVRTFSPVGYVGLNRFDGGIEPVEPLGAWSAERCAELASELDLVVIGGGELIHDRDEELAPHYGLPAQEMTERAPTRFFVEGLNAGEGDPVPTAWHAVGVPFDLLDGLAERVRAALAEREYVSVRDPDSVARLRSAGVELDIDVIPDPAFLAPRLFDHELLDSRLGFLRTMGWFPAPEQEALVVQGSRGLMEHVDAIAQAVVELCDRRGFVPVLVEMGPIHGDGEVADALAERLPNAIRPTAPLGVEDVIAAIEGSAGFVGNSLHGNILAAAFDKPAVALNLADQAKLDGLAAMLEAPERLVRDAADITKAFESAGSIRERVGELQERVDAHFDRLAALATKTAPRPRKREMEASVEPDDRDHEEEGYLLRLAHDALASRLAEQQHVFADRLTELQHAVEEERATLAEREEHLAKMQEEVEWLRGIIEVREAELRRIRSGRSYRLASRLGTVLRPFRHGPKRG